MALGLDDIFKDLVWRALVKLAISQLFKAIPFLAWGPIGLVVSFFLTKFANYLFDAVKEVIDLQIIVFSNEKLASEYAAAALTLKEIGQALGVDSEEFKNARQKHKESLAKLIQFGL